MVYLSVRPSVCLSVSLPLPPCLVWLVADLGSLVSDDSNDACRCPVPLSPWSLLGVLACVLHTHTGLKNKNELILVKR